MYTPLSKLLVAAEYCAMSVGNWYIEAPAILAPNLDKPSSSAVVMVLITMSNWQ